MSENVEKKGFMQKVKDSFKSYKGEFKKIIWPSWNTIVKNTGIVLAFIIIIAAVIYVIDFVFAGLFHWVIGLL